MIIFLYYLVILFHLSCASVLDRDSFIIVAEASSLVQRGRNLLANGSWNEGISYLRDSLLLFPSQEEAVELLMEAAAEKRELGQEGSAAELFSFVAEATSNLSTEAVFQAGLSSANMGRVEVAGEWYRTVLRQDPSHSSARINIAALHHYFGSVDTALEQYQYGLHYLGPYRYHHDGSSKDRGILDAEIMLRANMGAAYIQLKKFEKARVHVSNLIYDLLSVGEICSERTSQSAGSNFLRRLKQSRFVVPEEFIAPPGSHAISELATAVNLHSDEINKTLESKCAKMEEDLSFAVAHLLHIRRATCDWQDRELLETFLLQTTLDVIEGGSTGEHINLKNIVVLPFDSLLFPLLTLKTKLRIAAAFSQGKSVTAHTAHAAMSKVEGRNGKKDYDNDKKGPGVLRLGLLSYDFNNHPTAHLIEAILDVVASFRNNPGSGLKQPQVELYVYSYGKDDDSLYLHRIRSLATKFIDVSLASYEDMAGLIKSHGIDVLYDLQVHTLGNRIQTLSYRPAPIQVNYLVYPATSGAPFLDYVVADYVVVPPEHVMHYSEALLLLPASYQISYYSRHSSPSLEQQLAVMAAEGSDLSNAMVLKRQLRVLQSLPISLGTVVFCNFNKIDKFDWLSVSVWMAVMRRVPNSVLWLLEPTKVDPDAQEKDDQGPVLKRRLLSVAAASGVLPSRISFAPRVEKDVHLARQLAADLFLDTFTYGAHSTATDALRAGLPVLTVEGPAFTSRVGLSLYTSLCKGMDKSQDSQDKDKGCPFDPLVRHSVMEFENAAATLAATPMRVLALQRALSRAVVAEVGLFNHTHSTLDFVHGAASIHAVQSLSQKNEKEKKEVVGSPKRKSHVIVCR